jgi:hypothetical protein
MTPAERAQLQRRLESHLRCAERIPRNRAQHLKAAAHCAELLGFDLFGPGPALAPGPQKITDKVLRSHASARVRQTQRTRTCTICRESIRSGDLYLALANYKLCELCAKKYGSHTGAWKRGAWYQLLP